MICAICQAPHQPAQRFCAECGAALRNDSGPSTSSTSPAVSSTLPELASAASLSAVRAMGERRDVAILFADLTNFTGLSTEIDAEDLHTVVRSYTQRVAAVVHAFGGVVERYIGDSVLAVFGAYLLLWAVAVTGALTNGSGLAIENLTGGAVPRSWGAVAHCLVAFGFIYSAHAGGFARVMKPLIVLMFVAIVLCAALTFSEPVAMLKGLVIPAIPKGAGAYVLSLVGGIGGSVTLLAYSYLLKEEERERPSLRAVRADLGIAYLFTAVFGLSVMLIANRVFFAAGVQISDADAVSRMADQLAHLIGPAGRLVYSFGFWAAVVASLFGVWQSVPFMIADCYALLRRLPEPERASLVRAGSLPYRAALTLMALSSIPFAFAGRPLLVIVAFTVLGSLFIPFLAATLLYLNNRIPFPAHVPRNHVMTNVVLVFVLALFLVVGGREIASIVSR